MLQWKRYSFVAFFTTLFIIFCNILLYKIMNKIKSNIKKIYLFEVLEWMFFSVPVIVLFWQENWLSLTEIMILQSLFAIITVLLEVPTWYFADKYWRKKSLIISAFSGFFAIVVYSIWTNFFHFLIAETFFALTVSFASWTVSALVYDSLENVWEEKKYKKIWWNIWFYTALSLAFSNIIGAFIWEINLRYTLYASIPFFALTIPIAFSIYEPKRQKEIYEKWYIKDLVKILKTNILDNGKIKWIIIYSWTIYAFNQTALWLYQPYFKLTWIDIIYFWIIFASFQIVSGFSSKYAYKLEEIFWEKFMLLSLIFLVSISYFLMSNFVFLFSFSFCFIQQFVRWTKKTIINNYINDYTKSSVRATILSVESFFSRLLYASVIPIIGYVWDIFSLQFALFILFVTSFLAWISIYIFYIKIFK